jgi:hypothetical protein
MYCCLLDCEAVVVKTSEDLMLESFGGTYRHHLREDHSLYLYYIFPLLFTSNTLITCNYKSICTKNYQHKKELSYFYENIFQAFAFIRQCSSKQRFLQTCMDCDGGKITFLVRSSVCFFILIYIYIALVLSPINILLLEITQNLVRRIF